MVNLRYSKKENVFSEFYDFELPLQKSLFLQFISFKLDKYSKTGHIGGCGGKNQQNMDKLLRSILFLRAANLPYSSNVI